MSVEMQGRHDLSSGSNSVYSGLYAKNPYRDQVYTKTPWQNFLTSLGIRTQADAWKENMSVQAAEYDAQIAQMEFQNQYNSPLEEVSRMRQAGLNPDLQGIGDVAEAANPSQDPSTPMQSTGDEEALDKVFGFAQMCMQAVSGGIGLAKNLADLKALGIANDQGEIGNTSEVARFADWLAVNTALDPSALNGTSIDPSSGDEVPSNFAHALDLANQYERSLPRKYRKQFRRNIATAVMSLKTKGESYKKALDMEDSREGLLFHRTSGYWQPYDNAMMDVLRPLTQLSDKKRKSDLNLGLLKNSKESEYLNNFKPTQQAKAENAINEYTSQKTNMDRQIDFALSQIVSNLSRSASKGDIFAQSMLLSFSLMRMTSIGFGPKGFSIGFNK